MTNKEQNMKKVEEGDMAPKEFLANWASSKSLQNSYKFLFVLQIFLIILFATVGVIKPMDPATDPGTISQGYQYFIGVEIMMFIGFGYLMTFMKTYGLGAVGFTMLITAIGAQFYVFAESFFHQIYNENRNEDWHNVNIGIYELLNALFGVSAVLISFGAVIGKIKPFQLMVMAFIELIIHAFNYEVILVGAMKTADIGGTYADHMFGAYFGLAVSYFLKRTKNPSEPEMGYVGDIFAFIGTLFLWIYWPSFVGGGAQADSVQQQRAIINTILALSASTLTAFYLSATMSKHHFEFRPVDIQNATLAGGVAIGCVANFNLNPVNAILIGSFAGLISTYGYKKIQPKLFARFGLHDTCGVHNLHGMPSIVGGIASIILAAYKQSGGRDHDSEVFMTNHGNQAWRQFVSILLVITCAVVFGAITAFILNFIEPKAHIDEFDDAAYWETAEDYHYKSVLEFGKQVHDAVVLDSKITKNFDEEIHRDLGEVHNEDDGVEMGAHQEPASD